jgi:hypothetical protein
MWDWWFPFPLLVCREFYTHLWDVMCMLSECCSDVHGIHVMQLDF